MKELENKVVRMKLQPDKINPIVTHVQIAGINMGFWTPAFMREVCVTLNEYLTKLEKSS